MPDPTPDPNAPPPMPIPMGIYDTGGFASAIDATAMGQLNPQTVLGSVPNDTINTKGTADAAHLGMVGGELNANDLSMAGWAVMFGASATPQIKTNLTPLIDLRKSQAGSLFKILDPPTTGQSASDWLLAHKTSLNVVDPTQGVPYYVMIVASPTDVPFQFQYELDLYWGVGRLWLQNDADYEAYAHAVVDYETQATVPSARKMVIFAPDNDGKDNGAGKLLCDNLVHPMIAAGLGQAEKFKLQSFVGSVATKNVLNNIFTGSDPDGTPAILFTGSHGLLKAPDSTQLPDAMGAIVCEPWNDPPPVDAYYAAWDLPQNTKVHGLVHFLFDCYGVAWPQYDTYNYQKQVRISPAPMMARLPQALLKNGALAVLGHIDRAFASSYTAGGQPQDQNFRDVLSKIMSGYRLGNATDQFNLRWATLTIPLLDTLQKMQTKRGLNPQAANLLIVRDDARNYILHGDPAIKLRVGLTEMPPLAPPANN